MMRTRPCQLLSVLQLRNCMKVGMIIFFMFVCLMHGLSGRHAHTRT